MKGFIKLWLKIVVSSIILIAEVYAQVKDEVMVGVEWRTDHGCRFEYNVKKINGHKSLALKLAHYNYDAAGWGVHVWKRGGRPSSNLYSVHGATYTNTSSGLCLKPGWIFHHKLRKYFYYSHTLSTVFSRHEFQLNIHYPNDPVNHHMIDYTMGAEYEFLLAARLLNHFLVSAAFQFGIKPIHQLVYRDTKLEYYAYENYTPVQGYGGGQIYLNATFGLSYIF